MDSAGSDRPQRRTGLLGRELDRYEVEIAALSDTRLTEDLEDQMQYLQRSTKQEPFSCRKSDYYFTLSGEKKPSFKN